MTPKKSRTFSVRKIYNRILRAFSVLDEDRVTVYAAQATLFIITSVIPFIMLLFTLSKYIIPDRFYDVMISFADNIPGGGKDLYMSIINEMIAKPGMELISLTAVLSFWTASRGINAVRAGVATVYKTPNHKNYFYGILVSFAYTAVFIVLIIALVTVLLFGEQLFNMLTASFKFFKSYEGLLRYRNGVFFIILALFFSLLYCTVGRRGNFPGKRIRDHIPGAFVASLGWLLFSYIYSLYTLYFTGASYIYGSLTAIVLLIFWLYACMIILLCGAEFNKMFALFSRRMKMRSDINHEIKSKKGPKSSKASKSSGSDTDKDTETQNSTDTAHAAATTDSKS